MAASTPTVRRSAPVDGFRLTYDDIGSGDPVVLLHGWPGHRADYARVVPLLAGRFRLLVPDLRGFGDSDRHPVDPEQGYTAQAQVRSVLGILDDLGLPTAVLAGYDVGARLVVTAMTDAPHRLRAVATTPPLPGAGTRVLAPGSQAQFWYQSFNRLPVADALVDGDADAVRAYLGHIWRTWSGEEHPLGEGEFDRLVELYARPGAFTSSIGWYRSRPFIGDSATQEHPPAATARSSVPLEVVWPDGDPLFPLAWSDRLAEWFTDFRLTPLHGCGHFVPWQAPEEFAAAVVRAADRTV